MNRRSRPWLKFLIPIPFIIGVIGHLMAGFAFNDACYGSLCYYFVSVYDQANNPLMEIARWTAPLVTFSWLVVVFKDLWKRYNRYTISRRKSSVAIYYRNSVSEAALLSYEIPNSFLVYDDDDVPTTIYSNARDSIILMGNDRQALEFYDRHMEEFGDSRIHIVLNAINPVHLRGGDIHYFSIPDEAANQLWKQYPLIQGHSPEQRRYSVAIIGEDLLGYRVLSSGLSLNLFYDDQCVEYHCFGNWEYFKRVHANLDLYNDDRIVFHDKNWWEELDFMNEMDRIIIAHPDNIAIIEALLDYCMNPEILYYSESDENPAKFYSAQSIHDWGTTSQLLTKDSIIDDNNFKLAKNMFYLYGASDILEAKRSLDSDAADCKWCQLDGQMRKIVKSGADYYDLYTALLNDGYPLESSPFDMANLSHIRWCRNRALSFWKYGVPEDGSTEDPSKRITKNLVPYDDLPEEIALMELQQIIFMMHAFKDFK